MALSTVHCWPPSEGAGFVLYNMTTTAKHQGLWTRFSGDTAGRPDRQLSELLSRSLGMEHDVILLPGFFFDTEENVFVNMVFDMNGDEKHLEISAFNEDWGVGVSAIRLPLSANTVIEQMLECGSEKLLTGMKNAVPSETADETLRVGPQLQRTEERDSFSWEAGLTSGSFAGLYRAKQDGIPFDCADDAGLSREQTVYYLVAKCGAGQAAAEFHSRFCNFLRDGMSITEVLQQDFGSCTGLDAHDRCLEAARRNRARVLHRTAIALNLSDHIDSVLDHVAALEQSPGSSKQAVLHLDSVTNCFSCFRLGSLVHHNSGRQGDRYAYFAGSVNGNRSEGLISLSNLASGLKILVSDSESVGSLNARAVNPPSSAAFGGVPFCSFRKETDDEVLSRIARGVVHSDSKWLRERFVCKLPPSLTTGIADDKVDLPAPLWGTHVPEKWIRMFSHTFNVEKRDVLSLCPLVVLLTNSDKLKTGC